ncbi:MAG TPA: TauD/TfdA family dioxygenase [Burkholderiales bacterium]|nr:TauD/TfdA family dioxygenase [Burkholderiales bacterium]
MLEIRKLGRACGAEVLGANPLAPLNPSEIREIEQAFLDHLVLRFRDCSMSIAQLRDFARQFGPLREHVAKNYRDPEVPEVVIMTNQDERGNYDRVGAERGVGWHSDGTFEAVPPKATVLHAIAVPDRGGNTIFANMYLAYETMPADLKKRVDGKSAIFRLRGRKQHTQGIVSGEDLRRMNDVMHPVIRVHPQTGRKSVFVNPHHTVRIADMSDSDSEALLEEIFAWCIREEFQWEQEWRAGDTIMWENRSAWHSGRPDYPKDQLRRFLRTTICEGIGSSAATAH